MANTAHLVRRQSSRDLKPQKSVDKLEMKEMRGRLVVDNRKSMATANYGATNVAFEDTSPNKVTPPLSQPSLLICSLFSKYSVNLELIVRHRSFHFFPLYVCLFL